MFCSTTQGATVAHRASSTSKVVPTKRTRKDYFTMLKAVRKGYPQLTPTDKYMYEILAEYSLPYRKYELIVCWGLSVRPPEANVHGGILAS
jgi:hypothetical protein